MYCPHGITLGLPERRRKSCLLGSRPTNDKHESTKLFARRHSRECATAVAPQHTSTSTSARTSTQSQAHEHSGALARVGVVALSVIYAHYLQCILNRVSLFSSQILDARSAPPWRRFRELTRHRVGTVRVQSQYCLLPSEKSDESVLF